MGKRSKEEATGKKGAMEMEQIAYWIIGFIVLVIVVAGYMILRGKGGGALDFVKNLFRFGGKGATAWLRL